MEGKVCSKCKEWKAFGEFHKSKKTKDGHRYECKTCRAQYLQDNSEYYKEYKKQWRKENPEYEKQWREANVEHIRQYDKQYNEANVERRKQWKKQWLQTNTEHAKQYNEKWRQNNVEHCKEYAKQYRQSEQGREITYQLNVKRRSYKHKVNFTPFERTQILNRDNWECQSCGNKVHDRSTGDWNTPDKAHIDHIIPITKGGDSTPKNLRVLCRTCNLTKYKNQDEQLKLFN